MRHQKTYFSGEVFCEDCESWDSFVESESVDVCEELIRAVGKKGRRYRIVEIKKEFVIDKEFGDES